MPTSRSKMRSERIRYGLISLVIGALLAVLIIANADHERRSGNAQIAEDSLLMLWSPAIFVVAGAGFIARGLVRENPLRRRPTFHGPRRPSYFNRRVKAGPAPSKGPAPEPATRPPAAPSPAPRGGRPEPQQVAGTTGETPGPEMEPTTGTQIPLDDRYRQACAELGVEPGTDWMVIRAIWRRKLQSWHPDQGGDHGIWLRKTAAYTLLEAWEQFKT
ncbi:hypothetical protein [Cyanobium sp. Morenito 9A2]|uniref:hypothetical protein n=1 Tax=Cyanobium sp. Morenito 9A2 TaxID=2823718 RepID=UPI0020CFCBE2|nr:hypothetical protein [Cyanobium sp. Morenito 9A2]MCP9850139.1 hypothetical protein [Cyanobium sp. Morenito 9A2]